MSKTQLGRVLLLLALLAVDSQAQPIRGRRTSFGMGLLGGALMGGVVGHAVARHSATPAKTAPASAPVAQVVENGVPDANGCYKQTVKEPVAGHRKLYTETVHLICPHGMPAVPAVAATAHVVPVAAGVHHVVAAPAQGFRSHHSNGTHVQTVLLHPAGVPVPTPARPAGISVVYGTAPAVPAHHSPPAAPGGPARVVLLSKTVKKQTRSAAPSVHASHALIILLVFCCLLRSKLSA